ncbi:hypothetical protein BKA70DRAFT_1235285 [Coprinopsis sp. MPI-PUGE-AT-0042]|nr:hypothetical protein BKA70DRAFT_1235285 [Coprinopsis sp. MPI-PUGE-AT-0042]
MHIGLHPVLCETFLSTPPCGLRCVLVLVEGRAYREFLRSGKRRSPHPICNGGRYSLPDGLALPVQVVPKQQGVVQGRLTKAVRIYLIQSQRCPIASPNLRLVVPTHLQKTGLPSQVTVYCEWWWWWWWLLTKGADKRYHIFRGARPSRAHEAERAAVLKRRNKANYVAEGSNSTYRDSNGHWSRNLWHPCYLTRHSYEGPESSSGRFSNTFSRLSGCSTQSASPGHSLCPCHTNTLLNTKEVVQVEFEKGEKLLLSSAVTSRGQQGVSAIKVEHRAHDRLRELPAFGKSGDRGLPQSRSHDHAPALNGERLRTTGDCGFKERL